VGHLGGQRALPDALLQEKARDEGFPLFYRRNFGRAVATLLSAGASTGEAADAVQEAMIDLYRRCGAVEYPSRWVQTAAFRTWMHQKERQRRVRPVDAIEHFDLLCSDDQNAMVELRADLLTVARRLPTAQGQVLALHVKGLSHKEIAHSPLSAPQRSGQPSVNTGG
jgi:DNA-directed RNA polymerase specialized sigma24 family protein